MEATTLIVALIAGLASFGGSLLANNKTQAVMHEQILNIREDIATLSNRVDKHNNLVERTAVLERDIKSAFSKIDDITKERHG